MNALDMIRDVLARIIWIRDELDPIVRDQALEDLECDVASWLGANERLAA